MQPDASEKEVAALRHFNKVAETENMLSKKWYATSKQAEDVIERMRTPVYEWPRWLRRAYVVTWPLSFWVRVVAFAVVAAYWLACGIADTICYTLACKWHGLRNMWGD